MRPGRPAAHSQDAASGDEAAEEAAWGSDFGELWPLEPGPARETAPGT